jgi:glutathione synthase/RimK-type ligase-like ATP-grasp enzyme
MKQNIIGTTEYIYLPDMCEDAIPTKVDTGADGSAIWASSINERDGELSYILFAPQSAFYTGKVLTTKEYYIVSVKNSFGEKEYRYRVKIRVKIGKKIYKTTFTLADRSRSRFPVLLGKRFLKERFLVDVSRHNLTYDAKGEEAAERVVVLTSRIDAPTKEFFKTVEELSAASIELTKYRLLEYEINSEGIPKIMLEDGSDIGLAQMVYFKAHALYPEHAAAIARYLQYRHVDFIDKEVARFVSRSKLSELFVLATSGIPVPATKVYSNGMDNETYTEVTDYFGEGKFVLKDAFGDRGKDNYLVSDATSFRDAVERLEGKRTIIAQRFIPNDGFLRILLVGDEIVQLVFRSTAEHDDPLKSHLNKPRGSANAKGYTLSDIDPGAVAMARRAALSLERTVVGIDLIQDKNTKKWYVLEANYNPEITSGYDVRQKAKGLAKLLTQRR